MVGDNAKFAYLNSSTRVLKFKYVLNFKYVLRYAVGLDLVLRGDYQLGLMRHVLIWEEQVALWIASNYLGRFHVQTKIVVFPPGEKEASSLAGSHRHEYALLGSWWFKYMMNSFRNKYLYLFAQSAARFHHALCIIPDKASCISINMDVCNTDKYIQETWPCVCIGQVVSSIEDNRSL